MELDRDTKNMIAVVALVAAFAFGINALVVPDVDQSFMGWSIGLFVVAVLFWIWIRRDDMAAKREDSLQAAEDAAQRAEELAKAAQDKAAAELDKGKEKIEVIADEVHDYTEELEEAVEEAAEDAEETVAEVTDDVEDVADDITEEVVEETEAVAEAVEEVTEAVTPEVDDLSRIEGIGPVYQEILKDAGLTTFASIAEKTQEELEEIIAAAGKRRPASIETWSEQAEYAAKGDWDGLEKFQDTLDGGRRPS